MKYWYLFFDHTIKLWWREIQYKDIFSYHFAQTVSFSKVFRWISLKYMIRYMGLSEFMDRFLQVVTWICQYWYMDFSKLLQEFVKIDIWISFRFYLDFSNWLYGFVKVLHGFVKFVLCVSRPLPNKTKLKFDQSFNACEHVEASALN